MPTAYGFSSQDEILRIARAVRKVERMRLDGAHRRASPEGLVPFEFCRFEWKASVQPFKSGKAYPCFWDPDQEHWVAQRDEALLFTVWDFLGLGGKGATRDENPGSPTYGQWTAGTQGWCVHPHDALDPTGQDHWERITGGALGAEEHAHFNGARSISGDQRTILRASNPAGWDYNTFGLWDSAQASVSLDTYLNWYETKRFTTNDNNAIVRWHVPAAPTDYILEFLQAGTYRIYWQWGLYTKQFVGDGSDLRFSGLEAVATSTDSGHSHSVSRRLNAAGAAYLLWEWDTGATAYIHGASTWPVCKLDTVVPWEHNSYRTVTTSSLFYAWIPQGLRCRFKAVQTVGYSALNVDPDKSWLIAVRTGP